MTIEPRAEEPLYEITERTRGRVKVTMEWEVEADLETSEGNGVRCVDWIADPQAVVDKCTLATARLTMEKVDE